MYRRQVTAAKQAQKLGDAGTLKGPIPQQWPAPHISPPVKWLPTRKQIIFHNLTQNLNFKKTLWFKNHSIAPPESTIRTANGLLYIETVCYNEITDPRMLQLTNRNQANKDKDTQCMYACVYADDSSHEKTWSSRMIPLPPHHHHKRHILHHPSITNLLESKKLFLQYSSQCCDC